jgi:hypothetical protein
MASSELELDMGSAGQAQKLESIVIVIRRSFGFWIPEKATGEPQRGK